MRRNVSATPIWGCGKRCPRPAPPPLLPYLCKIVRNLSLKAYRKRGTAKRGGAYTVAMEELEEALAGRDSVEEALEAGELTRSIQSFLDTLSAENRVIFLRRYWFADSYEEIARRVGLSQKNVSVRLTRVRRELKKHLIREGVLL